MREILFIDDGPDKKLNFAPAKETEKRMDCIKRKIQFYSKERNWNLDSGPIKKLDFVKSREIEISNRAA